VFPEAWGQNFSFCFSTGGIGQLQLSLIPKQFYVYNLVLITSIGIVNADATAPANPAHINQDEWVWPTTGSSLFFKFSLIPTNMKAVGKFINIVIG